MVFNYGMAIMNQRTTFALDRDTRVRLKRLSERWRVSQAEVVRRAVAQAEKNDIETRVDPVEQLESLHARGGGILREQAAAYLRQVRDDRETWRGR